MLPCSSVNTTTLIVSSATLALIPLLDPSNDDVADKGSPARDGPDCTEWTSVTRMGLTREGWPNIGSNGSDVFGGVIVEFRGYVDVVCSYVSPRPTVAWVDDVSCVLVLFF